MSDSIQQLREHIQQSLALWKVPSVGVAIVQGEDTLLCEGFGLRDIEGGQPATANSLYAIGSATKAFTTFGMGLLVDEGKLDWDQPLRDFLPTFQMHDPVASQRLTPRDIVSHRVGLPRHDFVWYNSSLARAEIYSRLRYLEPNKDIRQTFQYNNLMFMTAGVLIEHLSGQTWEEFTRRRIFEPLGMARSNFSVTTSQQSDDFALPYHEKKDQVERMPFRNIDAVGPCGSINSSAADMLQWVKMHLNQGRVGGRSFITSGNLEQMHAPQMIVPGTSKWKELLPGSYGLGWFTYPYRGFQVVEHGGNIDGFSAMVAMIPSEKIGVVALTNLGGNNLRDVLPYHIFDVLLGLPPVDWNERYHKDYLEVKAGMEKSKEKSAAARQENHPPAHPLEDYAGTYSHRGYGPVEISVKDGKMSAVYNGNVFQVTPYAYEVFEFFYELIDMRIKGTFTTDEKGNVTRLALPMEEYVKEIVFERVVEARMRERAFLERLAGVYELLGMRVSIALKGEDTLTGTLPGEPSFELLPYRGTTFTIKEMASASITFTLGESGPAEALELTQPGIVLVGKRIQDA